MKKILLVVLITLFANSLNAQKTYVLLAGVSSYSNSQANLSNTTKDVKELKKVFDRQGAIVAILTSKYANHDNIVEKMEAIVKIAKSDDKIIFFFSGHGDTGGFITYELSLFKYKELADILAKAKTKNVFCFIDACMAGSATNDSYGGYGWSEDTKKKGLTFMLSCRADEYSFENDWVGNGFFTKALLKGIRGMSDRNSDRQITLIELFTYVHNDVTARTKESTQVQHPQLIGPSSAHDVIIAKW